MVKYVICEVSKLSSRSRISKTASLRLKSTRCSQSVSICLCSQMVELSMTLELCVISFHPFHSVEKSLFASSGEELNFAATHCSSMYMDGFL